MSTLQERLRAAHAALDAAEAKLAAIDALHQPDEGIIASLWCRDCERFWPCPTHRTLHPEEGNR